MTLPVHRVIHRSLGAGSRSDSSARCRFQRIHRRGGLQRIQPPVLAHGVIHQHCAVDVVVHRHCKPATGLRLRYTGRRTGTSTPDLALPAARGREASETRDSCVFLQSGGRFCPGEGLVGYGAGTILSYSSSHLRFSCHLAPYSLVENVDECSE